MTSWWLLADVGGTNVRFARAVQGEKPVIEKTWQTASYATFEDALSSYVAEAGGLDQCEAIAIAAAGPQSNGSIALTNGRWLINADHVSAAFHGIPVSLVNDLEAVAYALPYLAADDVAPYFGDREAGHAPRIAVNMGTGFGAALIVPSGASFTAVACEPGHMTLAIPPALHPVLGDTVVTIEDVLSGKGLQRLLGEEQLLADCFGSDINDQPSLLGVFDQLFGQVCRDLVMATGAWGGVYTCGSVASAWFTASDRKGFNVAFRAAGPMSDRMQRVFVGHITHPLPALVGLLQIIQANQ